jgi:galactose oxidase
VGRNSKQTLTSTYFLSNQTVSKLLVTNTEHDMFCLGLSLDTNRRMTVTGRNSSPRTSIYDLSINMWISGPDMNIPRGYQALVTCSDGRTFVIGRSWSGGTRGKNSEIYNLSANSWSLLPGCPVAPMLTNDAQGVYRADNHG